MNQLRAVVIDDSIVFRSQLIDTLSFFQEIRVVGFAADGKAGLEKVRQFKPDVVTLDVEMPVMNGIETLSHLRQEFPSISVIMVSSLTRDGSRETIKALELGAFDFITKPDLSTKEQNKSVLQEQLRKIIADLTLVRKSETVPLKPPVLQEGTLKAGKPKIIAIGVSTGGPKALATLIPQLPSSLSVPVVLVQHMPALFTASLAESLASKSKIGVVEAHQGDVLKAGTVYVAPGGYQMGLQSGAIINERKVVLTDDPAEHFCKPSVDYLFRSVAKEYKGEALGIILTGMGKDGALGVALMKRFGARIIAQNEQTSTVFGMPKEAIQTGAVDMVLPIESIAAEIMNSLI